MMVRVQHSGPAESSSDPNLVMRYFPSKEKAGKYLIFKKSTGHCFLQDFAQLQGYLSNTNKHSDR